MLFRSKPDALSRRAEHRPEKGGHDYQPIEHVLKLGLWVPGNYGEVIVASVQFVGLRPVVKMSKWLEEEIVSKVVDDLMWQELHDKAVEDRALEGRISMLVTYKDGILSRKGKIWIPNDPGLRMKIVKAEYDSQMAGHMGMDKIMELVTVTSTGQRWLKISRTMFAVVKTAKRTKHSVIRGIVCCILWNYPTLRGIQFPWTTLFNFPSQKAIQLSG